MLDLVIEKTKKDTRIVYRTPRLNMYNVASFEDESFEFAICSDYLPIDKPKMMRKGDMYVLYRNVTPMIEGKNIKVKIMIAYPNVKSIDDYGKTELSEWLKSRRYNCTTIEMIHDSMWLEIYYICSSYKGARYIEHKEIGDKMAVIWMFNTLYPDTLQLLRSEFPGIVTVDRVKN